ncbi:putative m serotype protein [Rosellinia necatrix]|uniref:Putative m serotype protein n=1 Tax=Rosellinia necatrix TaxID=77044 RepID=A0A1S7UJ65_ROSNE|nr:putative m serotype protein [Rosellinia necatrix]
MTTTPKKPSPSASGRASSADSTHPSPASRVPRATTPTSSNVSAVSTPATNGTPTRTRSIRAGTVSARAAAHRASSSLSISTSADADARAETVALIEDLKERLHKADATSEQYRKQAEVLQSRLDEALKEQAKLEERAHENEERVEALKNEKREAARQMREMEAIYEAERSSMMKEKEEMSNREEEMQTIINRLKETLNQRNAEDDRPSRQCEFDRPHRPSLPGLPNMSFVANNNSPSVESGNFAPPSSVQRSDSRNNSKLLLQKDKLIESLRLELAEAQIKLVESENQGGGRLHEVERLLMEARMANARLMEDNESYQLLLQEKTLHGDFGKGDFNYMGVSANQDALNALEGRNSTGSALAPPGTSLADELGSIADESEMGEDPTRRLEAELRAMKDQNKALTLYINKIIERLLQHQEFEHILDTSSDSKSSANVHKDLPPPPSAEMPGVGVTLLQRAKSIATGANTTARPKPRPVTMLPQQNSAHNNPDTAPSIPIGLGRAQSARRGGRPMSEQFTGAAGIVNAMYKGPDGPLSPTLSNPRNSASFFSGVSTPRVPSAGQGAPSAGNFPGMRSETSSVSGDSASVEGITSSPPRAGSNHTSISGSEKAITLAGNKPRPLRLVQENAPEKMENKRASWMGWASSAWSKKDDHTGESIRE